MPSSSLERSPQRVPEYVYYRNVAAVDVLADLEEKHGMNMAGYDYAHIQVVPVTGNPTVTVLWWSDGANKFIQEHTAISKTGVGDGIPYEFTVECRGRIMMVAVTVMTAGSAKIYVGGYGRRHPE